MNIEQILLSNQVAINNALSSPDILEALTVYGYDEARINEGKAILDQAMELFNTQKVEYSEQYDATSELNQTYEKANKAYMKTLKVSRIAFSENIKAQSALMLNGTRKRSLSGWIDQAETFYKNLLSADTGIGKGLLLFGYTVEKLNTEKALVDEVKKAHLAQKKEMGEAQDATDKRDTKFDELGNWVGNFIKIAKIALEENPQLLEKLGIKA